MLQWTLGCIFFVCLFDCTLAAHSTSVPWPWTEPCRPQWKHWDLTNGEPATSPQVSFWISVFLFFFRYIPRSRIACLYGISTFSFWEKLPYVLFFTVAAPIYFPTNRAREFTFIHSLTNAKIVICDLFENSYYGWHHIVVLIYSSLMVNNVSIFSSACWPYVFFGKKVYSGLLPIF